MPTPIANTYETFQAIGQREDLTDMIFNIAPTETPIVSSMGRGRAKAVLHEWQTDTLQAVDVDNHHPEGDDIDNFPAVTPSVRVGNYSQISRKLLILSDTLEVVDKAGRRSELAYQMALRGRELKRDMEAIVSANQGGAAGATDVPREMATLGAWLKTNTEFAADGADPVYTSGVPGAPRTDGTQEAFNEEDFLSVIQQGWEAGADIDSWIVYAGALNRQNISLNVDGVVQRNFDISNTPRPSAAIASIDVIVTDFGTVRVQADRFQRERDIWYLDAEFLELDFLRNPRVVRLAKTGDAEKRMLIQEWTLKVKNEAALGGYFDLTEAIVPPA